jgi:hypothetical protein
MVCLANSTKMGGRCIGGLTVATKEWIRPVSSDQDGTLYPRHYRLLDGSDTAVLDILEVTLLKRERRPHQPENWLLAPTPFRRLGRLSGSDALDFLRDRLQPGPELLGGRTDRVPFQSFRTDSAAESLALIEPRNLRWQVETWPERRRVRALFELGGVHYRLSLTDPAWTPRFAPLPDGLHPRTAPGISPAARVLLTISLGEPYEKDGCCYKMVAAVIVLG